MSRIRSIQPDFPQSPRVQRLSREARLLYILLWTAADDAGRCEGAPDALAARLYPADADASQRIGEWLAELECQDCIERYEADGEAYLRVLRWRRHQQISHPTPSRLPPGPSEPPRDPPGEPSRDPSRDSGIPEDSGNARRHRRKGETDQRLEARLDRIREIIADDTPVLVNEQSVLRDLRRIQLVAEQEGAHATALRAVEIAGRTLGLWERSRPSAGGRTG